MSFIKKYDQETQARAVRMVEELIEQGSSQAAARREVGTLLDINPSTLRNWFRRDKGDGITLPVGVEARDEELARLRRENAKLKKANEILRTASAFSQQRNSTANSDNSRLYSVSSGTVWGRVNLCCAFRAWHQDCPIYVLLLSGARFRAK